MECIQLHEVRLALRRRAECTSQVAYAGQLYIYFFERFQDCSPFYCSSSELSSSSTMHENAPAFNLFQAEHSGTNTKEHNAVYWKSTTGKSEGIPSLDSNITFFSFSFSCTEKKTLMRKGLSGYHFAYKREKQSRARTSYAYTCVRSSESSSIVM